jgi:UDP-N-acetyl-D-galactosamine dehydrogenase
MVGYHPQVILAGRRINDGMGKFIAEKTIKLMIDNGSPVKGASVNVLGLTFKENCPDIRNTRVIDVVRELESYGVQVRVHDPYADADDARHEYGIELCSWDNMPKGDALIVAVAHSEFLSRPREEIFAKVAPGGGFVDVKSRFDPAAVARAGLQLWRL